MKLREKDLNVGRDRILPPPPWHDYLEAWSQVAFKPGKPSCLENAWWLAEASLLAYEPANFIRHILLRSGMEGFRFWDLPSTQAFVSWREDWAMVVFRGTELKTWRSILDIVTDANLARKAYLGAWVHGGFLDAFRSAWEEADPQRLSPPPADELPSGRFKRLVARFKRSLRVPRPQGVSARHWAHSLPAGVPWASTGGMADFIARLRQERPGIKVFYAGHSLGAALASLAAASDPGAAALHAFGSPMVGDAAFAAEFAKKLSCPAWRWVNGTDLVTSLPPPQSMERALRYRYVHIGTPVYLDDEGRLGQAPADLGIRVSLDRDLRALIGKQRKKGALSLADLSALGRVGSILELKSLADHAPLAYALKVWNLLARGEKIG